MIGRLSGTLVELDAHSLIVDCGGVGYRVTVSGYTLAALPPVGDAVVLRIYTQVLETKIALFGFGSAEERQLFDMLITVKKVGPSSGMSILSGGAGPIEVAQLIAGGAVTALTKLKGVGKKTAEMLVVELRDKCELVLATWGAQGGLASGTVATSSVASSRRVVRPPILEDVAAALLSLGWKTPEVDKAIENLDADGTDDLEALLRQALRTMAR